MKQCSTRCLLAVLATAVAVAAPADTVVLYDPERGTTPDRQGWAYITRPVLVAKAQRSFSEGLTRLDTTPVKGEWAGFFSRVDLGRVNLSHPRMPKLDRHTGYTVRFRLRVAEEHHTGNDRAGFSVLVVGDDLRAVELGFWTDAIWAQSGPNPRNPDEPLFTHTVETSRVDTTELTRYELRVLGDSYFLFSGARRLLSGPLRDYSRHGHPVYRQANTIFLGDNTSRAAAVVEIGRVKVRTGIIQDDAGG